MDKQDGQDGSDSFWVAAEPQTKTPRCGFKLSHHRQDQQKPGVLSSNPVHPVYPC
jgi:hypothetical protein